MASESPSVVVRCNRPRVSRGWELSNLLYRNWCPVSGLYVEVTDERLNIQGSKWPQVYRIPPAYQQSDEQYYPGKCGNNPVGIEGLLAEAAPYLEEPLIVKVSSVDGDPSRTGLWYVDNTTLNVRSFVTKGRQQWRLPIEYGDHSFGIVADNGNFVKIREMDLVPLMKYLELSVIPFPNLSGCAPFSISMHKETALRLGLALVRGAFNCYDSEGLNEETDMWMAALNADLTGVIDEDSEVHAGGADPAERDHEDLCGKQSGERPDASGGDGGQVLESDGGVQGPAASEQPGATDPRVV